MEKHWKNLMGVSGGVFLSLGSFMTVVSLQSSIHPDSRGLTSLSIFQAVQGLTCQFAPLVITKIGTKCMLVLGQLSWCVFVACNLYPEPSVLLLTSTLIGVTSAMFSVALPTHVTTTALHLASVTEEKADHVVTRFLGIYFWFQKFSVIPGYLISSFVLYGGNSASSTNHIHPSNRSLDHCGGAASSCKYYNTDNYDNNSTSEHSIDLDQNVVNKLFGVLLACCFCGVLWAFFLVDTLPSFCGDTLPPKTYKVTKLLVTALRVMKTFHFVLLVPGILLNGLELSFYFGTFTKSFITCTRGVQNVGFVMTTGAIGGAFAAVVSGTAVKYVGRIFVFTLGFLSQLAFLLWMLLWQPNQASDWDIYVMAFGLGAGATLRTTQITALIGILFPSNQEGAYGSHLFFHYITYSLGYALNIFLCTFYQTIIITAVLIITMVTHYILEYDIKRTAKYEICEKDEKCARYNEVKKVQSGNDKEGKVKDGKEEKEEKSVNYGKVKEVRFVYQPLTQECKLVVVNKDDPNAETALL